MEPTTKEPAQGIHARGGIEVYVSAEFVPSSDRGRSIAWAAGIAVDAAKPSLCESSSHKTSE